jgi:hypothetical protein
VQRILQIAGQASLAAVEELACSKKMKRQVLKPAAEDPIVLLLLSDRQSRTF